MKDVQIDFGRVMTAMVTPFDEKGEINFPMAEKLARYLADNGSDSIVVAGTTGESPTLTKEEKLQLFKTVKGAVGDQVKVIAGTGSYDTRESIALSQRAQECGVDGVMVVAPYYNKPSQEGLYQHFKAIADSIDLPIMLYNIPGRTSVNMLPALVCRLAQIPNIVAIKEAAGNLDQVAGLKRDLPADFIVYCGDDSLTLPMLAVGAHGVVSVASHIVGNQLQEMVNAFLQGNIGRARELHLKLFPLFKNLFITSNPVPVKAALTMKGLQVGGVRMPLVAATEEELAVVKQTIELVEA